MGLSNKPELKTRNLLPMDGVVNYCSLVFTPEEADHYMKTLLNNVLWQHDQAMIFGKRVITKRQMAWYADEAYSYTYSKITRTALPWLPELQMIKTHVENACNETFNSCLLNYYKDGSVGMGWHSDAEIDLIKNGVIASLSLGAARKFSLRHKENKQSISVELGHGSLLVMKGTTQTYWQHSLPKTTRVKDYRINLTFRQIRG